LLGQCVHGCRKCCTCLWRGFAFYFSIACLMVLVVCSCMQ
jgi:hypothetical protein